jgi:oligopeptide/dipeptide ABC transporter ATP-binding protein
METVIDIENVSESEARIRAIDALKLVGIPAPEQRLDDYPHQFSGGMRQRALIAIALSGNPKVLIADEPTTALDVTIQDQIIGLVRDLQKKLGMSVIWVTHDLGVVAQLCNRVAVLYAGQVMESASTIELFENNCHPYTRGLIGSIPSGGAKSKKLVPIPGQPPDLGNLPAGCPFAVRCRHADEACFQTKIQLQEVSLNHHTACLKYETIGTN